jgi:hypothetical protein
MATIKASTIEEYLESLPDDRRQAISAVREVINANLAPGFKEGMQYNMVGYYVPHTLYPAGYHCDKKQPLPFMGLGNQKGHMSLYMMFLYLDSPEDQAFREAYIATGKKLDMGASCVRFKKLEDLPLDVVAETIKVWTVEKYVDLYESMLAKSKSGKKK